MLRLRVVDGDDGEAERTVTFERLEPDHPGGRLLRARDDVAELLAPRRVQDADHVGAVVHRQLRLVVDSRLDVRVVRVVVLALDRENRDVVLVNERSGNVVLRRERVGGAKHHVGAAGLQCAGKVRGLGGHVETRRDAIAGERLLVLEALADRGEHGHLAVGPLDAAHALRRKRKVFHVMPFRRSHSVLSVI